MCWLLAADYIGQTAPAFRRLFGSLYIAKIQKFPDTAKHFSRKFQRKVAKLKQNIDVSFALCSLLCNFVGRKEKIDMRTIHIISKAEDLVTSREETRKGFVDAALEKNRKANKYIIQAKQLRENARKAEHPEELLQIDSIRGGLLTAAGLSEKSLKYFDNEDKDKAIEELIKKFLIPAGKEFVDELVYRFLLICGDTIGGEMRNYVGKMAQIKLVKNLLSAINLSQLEYDIMYSSKRKKTWDSISYEEACETAEKIVAIKWEKDGLEKVLFLNKKIPLVNKNIDLCLYRYDAQDPLSEDLVKSRPEEAIMFGELKGGIDPAGADEHWKTGNTALERIRDSFDKKKLPIQTSFVAAAIEDNMAGEIFRQLQDGTLSYAINMTRDDQLTAYCNWLINLK